jgi:hypothetical protein
MLPWLLVFCIDPGFMGCSILNKQYFETQNECKAALAEARLSPVDRAWCQYDPDHDL